jgi:hypothetical protein
MELLRVVNTPSRRKVIFADDSSKSSTLINELWQALLLSLGRSFQILSARGAPRRSPIFAPASAPPKAATSGPDPRAIAIKQADIFRPVVKQKSTFSLALHNVLDGPIRPTPPAPVAKVGEAAMFVRQRAVKGAEEVQARVAGRIEANPVGNKMVTEARGFSERTFGWEGRTWAGRKVEEALPDAESVQWIIDSERISRTILS